MSRRDYDYYYFPKTSPHAVKGGIKAQSRRGAFGRSWWAKRWTAVLGEFYMGARLSRGRSYARKGQVISIDVGRGMVKAQVQGSRAKPYAVTIEVSVLSEREWKKVAKKLSTQAFFTAKLLAGEMPQEIERVFGDAGLSLFPARRGDLKTDCTCPDWANPCKHIAAVYMLLGEEFDRDPFLIFTMRGKERNDLVALLSALPPAGAARKSPGIPSETEPERAPGETDEPLTPEPERFWKPGEIPADIFGSVEIPNHPAALPAQLGKFPFWRGETPLLDALAPTYHAASPRAMEIFLGACYEGKHSAKGVKGW